MALSMKVVTASSAHRGLPLMPSVGSLQELISKGAFMGPSESPHCYLTGEIWPQSYIPLLYPYNSPPGQGWRTLPYLIGQ